MNKMNPKDLMADGLFRLELLTTKYLKMQKIKCITFDKAAEDNLPQHIKDRMKADREKARKERDSKGLNIPVVIKSVCQQCGKPNDMNYEICSICINECRR